MNEQDFKTWLGERTSELPRSIEPQKDLWPAISAKLDSGAPAERSNDDSRVSRAWPFAAGMAATALVAIMVVQIVREGGEAGQPTSVAEQTGTEPGPSTVMMVEPQWVPDVRRASSELRPDYEASLENLSPETRAIVEENLAQIHESLAAIHEALSKDPSNAALHRLLAGTYQQELSLFSSIGALNKAEVEL